MPVWSLDDDYRLVPGVMREAWSNGEKAVFRITTRSGRTLRATDNHPLRLEDGWAKVSELELGHAVAAVGDGGTAHSDILWDEIKSIEPDGIEEVFDARVPGTHNFIADQMVVHNSGAIEQDADIVLFIYRHEYYHPEAVETKGIAEVAVAKHRQGSVGRVDLTFLPEFTLFSDMGRDTPVI